MGGWLASPRAERLLAAATQDAAYYFGKLLAAPVSAVPSPIGSVGDVQGKTRAC